MKSIKPIVLTGICVLFTAIIILSLSGCSSSKSSVKEGEHTPKKTYIEKKYNFVKNNDYVERNYVRSQKIKSIDKIEFDYDSDGQVTKGKKLSKQIYDQDGYLIETDILTDNGGILYKYTYKYDSSGYRIETLQLDNKNIPIYRYSYEYNDYGNKIKSVRYNMRGEIEKYYKYDYDTNGNLIDNLWYDKSGVLEYKIVNKYDTAGWKIASYSYDPDGKLLFRYVYEYDDSGNILDEVKYDGDDNKIGVIQYVYVHYKK